jgi:uncharacterized protein YutE (UPF0331/DUF86 family)
VTDFNQDYLLEQFGLAEEYLKRARGLASRSRTEYLNDPYAIDASVRELTVLFETAHNIAKHLISRNGWRAPLSKAEAFEILGEQGVLHGDLVESFRDAARFRNLVTYQTAVIKDEIVYQILQDHLSDFEHFLSDTARWLSGENS